MTQSEFWGSIVAGILSTIVYAILSWLWKLMAETAKYRYIKSNDEEFDWICYNMDHAEGRQISEKNGAIVRITSKRGNVLNIRLMHPGTGNEGIRQWRGLLTMTREDMGIISLRYDDNFEFDIRQVFVGTSEEGKFDFIYYKGNGKDYGSELMQRSVDKRPAPKPN